jgi:hypothetical protein
MFTGLREFIVLMQAGYWFCVLAVHGLQGASAYLIIELVFTETLKFSVVTMLLQLQNEFKKR